MSENKIGNYIISSEIVYQTLKDAKITSDSELKTIDKNNDNKINEDELAEFIEDMSSAETTQTGSSTSATSGSASSASNSQDNSQLMIEQYKQSNQSLRESIQTLLSSICSTGEDSEAIFSAWDQILEYEKEIDNNLRSIMLIISQQSSGSSSSGGVSSISGTDAISGTDSISSVTNNNVSTTAANKGSSGSTFTNSLTSLAKSYVGMLNEYDGSYKLVTNGRSEAWCADFVTWCVKKAAQETGADYSWLGSPSVSTLRSQAESKGVFLKTAGKSDKASLIANNVKPGDIMIEKENGKSHTGIVVAVNSDGSFTTIEGNCSNSVKQMTYSANSKTLTGFIRMS